MSNFEGAMDNARQFTETLCQIIESLEAEIAELRAGQGRWPKEADAVSERLPRIITADELREGQLICIHRGHSWGLRAIGIFVNLEGNLVTIKAGGGRTFTESVQFHTIVLLEDVPTSEGDDDADQDDKPIYVGPQPPYSHAILPDGRIFSYDQAKHIKDGDPETKPAPRLTVHALNVAPVGSWISRGMGSNGRRKADDGLWEKAWLFPGQDPDTSEELIANGWADATLTLPEES